MIRMSRAELEAARGKPAQEPAPAPAAAPAPDHVSAALVALADQQKETAQAVALLVNRPKQLVAEIVRDKDGRMSRVIVNITERD